ncbi:MAG TPA: HD domain-containing protein [Candidatus Scybalousia intestinigallinarum]|nr:HD domain-containing protein [Candidatus Scybalousia intestinigallinarum]
MEKTEVFRKEIDLIHDLSLVPDFEVLINSLPDYFFEVEASTTGKYHPKFALGTGGLVRHTKVAVRFGYELLNDPCIGGKYTAREKDLMLMALTLHDGLKCGNPKERYTRADHPLLVCEHIKNQKDQLKMSEEEVDFICHVISTHMGPWNTDYYTKEEILPKPKDKYQNFVHMCDYLASRKFVQVEFDSDNNIIG